MKTLLFLVLVSTYQTDNIKYAEQTIMVDDIILKSDKHITATQKTKINNIYKKAYKIFFDDFEEDLYCHPKGPRINIVSLNIIRSPKYFEGAGPRDIGKYMPRSKEIFISYAFFIEPHYLAHELAHYWYDVCDVRFENIKIEHDFVNKFQEIYKNERR